MLILHQPVSAAPELYLPVDHHALWNLLHLPSHSQICNQVCYVWLTQIVLPALMLGGVPVTSASPSKFFVLGSQPCSFGLPSLLSFCHHPCFGLCLRSLPFQSFFLSVLFPFFSSSFFLLLSFLSFFPSSPCFFSVSVKANNVIISLLFTASLSRSAHPLVWLQLVFKASASPGLDPTRALFSLSCFFRLS